MATRAGEMVTTPQRRSAGHGFLPYLLSLPALLVCIGILIPFFTAVWYSLQRYNLALPFTRGFIWFDNYKDFISDPSFWNTVQVSLLYTFLTVGLELLLGLGIAMLLRRPTLLNNAMSVALMLPLMIAPAIASLMWKLMTNPNFGILSYLVSLVGIENFKWASDPSTALLTVVLVDIWVYTPFMMVLLLAGLRALPPQPFEAAELDGVPATFVFFRITLPMLTPYIITAIFVPDARFHPAVRHHLRHDPGRPGRHAPRLPGRGLSRVLPVHQRRPLGGPADGAMGDHLRAQQPVHQAVAAPARARPRHAREAGHAAQHNHRPRSSAASS